MKGCAVVNREVVPPRSAIRDPKHEAEQLLAYGFAPHLTVSVNLEPAAAGY